MFFIQSNYKINIWLPTIEIEMKMKMTWSRSRLCSRLAPKSWDRYLWFCFGKSWNILKEKPNALKNTWPAVELLLLRLLNTDARFATPWIYTFYRWHNRRKGSQISLASSYLPVDRRHGAVSVFQMDLPRCLPIRKFLLFIFHVAFP